MVRQGVTMRDAGERHACRISNEGLRKQSLFSCKKCVQVFSAETENGIRNWDRSIAQKAVAANKKALTNSADGGKIKATGYTKPNINAEEVYQQAKNQGRHAGTYRDSINKSQAQLSKSINSHQNQVDEHFDKLNNPKKYDVGWNNKTEKQKQGLLKKWQKDMIRNAEQAEIERRIYNERFENE